MVRTRIAPSPTGDPHIGTAYTALFNFAFTRKFKGKFILRIEDTDRTRLVPGAEQKIIDSLKWLGLVWDEGPYRQSERLIIYQKAAKELVEKGAAYYCNCTSERLAQVRAVQQAKGEVPAYDRKCRLDPSKAGPFVVRLKVPEAGETAFEDLIRGKITFKNKDIDDAVLLKSDSWPTYHLAAVVDDTDMGITHVIRAEEWLSSTPKQILLYAAFGNKPPAFVHLPLLRNPDKSKISKRKNPVAITWYRDQGYLPQALVNYLALMGWSMPNGKEIFSLEEFIENFDLKRVDPTGPVFDMQKLDWLNGEYIRSMPAKELTKRLSDYTKVKATDIVKVLPLIVERMKKLSEFNELAGFIFNKEAPAATSELLVPKDKTKEEAAAALRKLRDEFEKAEVWNNQTIEKMLEATRGNISWQKGEFYMMVRVAVSGSKVTPPLIESLALMDKNKVIAALKVAAEKL